MSGASSGTPSGVAAVRVALASPRLGRLLRLARAGATAVADQGIAAVSSLVIGVLLARWLGAEDYGAYMVAFSCFLLAQNLYDAAMVEPMTVYGAGRHGGQLRRYMRIAGGLHLWLALGLGLLLAGGGAVMLDRGSAEVGWALVAAGAGMPLLLTRWLLRPPFYILRQHHRCVMAAALQTAVTVLGLGVLAWIGWLSPATAFAAQAVATAAAALFLILHLHRMLPRDAGTPMRLGGVAADHWRYGRWSIPGRLFEWAGTNALYLAVPALATLSSGGTFRAVALVIMPALLVLGSMGPLVLPAFARVYEAGGQRALDRMVVRMVALVAGATVLFGVFVVAFGELVVSLLYGGRFDGMVDTAILAAAAAQVPFTAVSFVLGSALRAGGRVRSTFFAQLPPTLSTLTLGLFLVDRHGVLGAFLANDLAGIITMTVLAWFYRRGAR